jgi:hypothetical protein
MVSCVVVICESRVVRHYLVCFARHATFLWTVEYNYITVWIVQVFDRSNET